MAKTRLNKTHRNVLRNHMYKVIQPDKLNREVDVAYKKLLAEVKKQHDLLFTEEDRKVLRKYEYTRKATYFRFYVTLDTKEVVLRNILLRLEDRIELPKSEFGDVKTLGNFKQSSKLLRLDGVYEDKQSKASYARSSMHSDFHELIKTSRYFEDVVEVWAGAADVAGDIVGTSTMYLSTLSADAIARIKKHDRAARKLKRAADKGDASTTATSPDVITVA